MYLDATIVNILSGNIPDAPITPVVGKETAPIAKKEFSTDLVAESLKDGSNPIKTWMNQQQRKTALLQFARAKYLSKHSH